MGIKFDFSNVRKKLSELSKKAQNETLDLALNAGNEVVIEELKSNVPIKTGELERSLGEIKKRGSGTQRTSILGIKSSDKTVKARAYYTEKGNRRQIGTHWMKISFNKSKIEAKEKIVEVLKEELKI